MNKQYIIWLPQWDWRIHHAFEKAAGPILSITSVRIQHSSWSLVTIVPFSILHLLNTVWTCSISPIDIFFGNLVSFDTDVDYFYRKETTTKNSCLELKHQATNQSNHWQSHNTRIETVCQTWRDTEKPLKAGKVFKVNTSFQPQSSKWVGSFRGENHNPLAVKAMELPPLLDKCV